MQQELKRERVRQMAITKVNHIAIAVKDIEQAVPFYRDVLKLPYHGEQIVESAGCKVAFFACGETEIELVQAIADFATVKRYIEEHGEGLYHIAYEVDNLEQDMAQFTGMGVKLRNEKAKPGANNTIVNYIDADQTGGVICELVQKQ